MPERIQQRRTMGWRMPLNARSVARPSRFGNPFTVTAALDSGLAAGTIDARIFVVQAFSDWLRRGEYSDWYSTSNRDQLRWIVEHLHELTGRDLACFCPPPEPGEIDWCHAQILIEESNA